jgi:hypothetical protein
VSETKEQVAQWLRVGIRDYESKKKKATSEAEKQKAEGAVEALKQLQKKVMGQL